MTLYKGKTQRKMQKVSSYDILKGNAHLSHARDYTTYNFNFQVFVRYF